jgi:REase_DpnII-MboI
MRTYVDVASLGFLATRFPDDQRLREKLTDGLKWMAGRKLRVEGSAADFCGDSLALLGMAVGAKCVQTTVFPGDWFTQACGGEQLKGTDLDAGLRRLALLATGDKSAWDLSPEVGIVGFATGLMTGPRDENANLAVIENLRFSTVSRLTKPEAVIALTAFRFIERSEPNISFSRPTVQDVGRILSGLQSGLTRWTWEDHAKTSTGAPRKWHIDNEYHLQNLLWCLLRPIFPDAKEEEYKSSVGQVHPRLDIVIPSLRLIIEAKFWRLKDSSKNMTREIAEDSGLYLTRGDPYDAILPVIWDEGRRTEEHSALKAGLAAIEGVVHSVVIAKPGLMFAEQPKDDNQIDIRSRKKGN